jgi:lysophospholipase
VGTGELTRSSFVGAGGRRIAWRRWDVPHAARAVVVIVHGFGEHSGRYGYAADRLSGEGYLTLALDHHGHGESDGPRGRISFAGAVADLDRLVDMATQSAPDLPVFMLGHSMGGAIALRYALAHGERLAGLILSGPLVQVEGRAAAKLLGRALGSVAPGLPLARLDPNLVSRDPEVVRAYREDPLVHHDPLPAGTVAEFLRYAATLPDEVHRIELPTLLLYGTADGLCAPEGSVLVAERIGSGDLETKPYEGLYHEILNEPERDRVLDDICAWLDARAPALSA